jgi:hypothetical protein
MLSFINTIQIVQYESLKMTIFIAGVLQPLENDLPMLNQLLMPRLIQRLILNSGHGLSPDAYILHTSQSMGNNHVALKKYECDY